MKTKNYLFLIALPLMLLFINACDSEIKDEAADNPELSSSGNPAIDGLSQKIAGNPNDATLYAARAGVWLQNGGYDEAIVDLQSALLLDSTNVEYHHILADLYLDYFRSRLALKTMERVVRLHPKRIPTLLKMAEVQLILKLYNQSLYTLERVRVIDPQHPEMYFMFGSVFREMGEIDRAINSYQSAVENNSDLIDAWFKLGELWAEKGESIAEKYFDNALRVDSNHVEALKAKAIYLANTKNDLPGAVKLYRKINVLTPQNEEGFLDTGLVFLDMDSLDNAYECFDIAVKNSPTYIKAYYYRGVASELKGDFAKAKIDYEDALKMAPNYEKAQEALDAVNKQLAEGS